MVFSKLPIENLSENVDQGKWRYTYFRTKYNKNDYYFYLIHTSSPVSYDFFKMRNNQFDILTKDFIKHDQNQNDKVMIL